MTPIKANTQDCNNHKARILDAVRGFMTRKAAGRPAKSTVKVSSTTANLFATPDGMGQAQAEMTNCPHQPEKINPGANKVFFRFRPAPKFLQTRYAEQFQAVESMNAAQRVSVKGVSVK